MNTNKELSVLIDFKRQREERAQPIDTEVLQLLSIYLFASKLGYKSVVYGLNFTKGFHNPNCKHNQFKFVSFDTMKHWHNNPFADYAFSSKINLAVAASSRIVEKVKLQRTKSGIKAQNHYVKLVTESREDYLMSKLAEDCPSLKFEQLELIVKSGWVK